MSDTKIIEPTTDTMLFLSYTDEMLWIVDLRDASHPKSIPLGLSEIQPVVSALLKAYGDMNNEKGAKS